MTTASSQETTQPHGAEQVTWNLADLYAGVEDAGRDLEKVEKEAEIFASTYRGRVSELDASSLAEAMRRFESLEDLHGKIEAFAYLQWSADTGKPENGAFLQKVREASSRITQLLLFFELEWLNSRRNGRASS